MTAVDITEVVRLARAWERGDAGNVERREVDVLARAVIALHEECESLRESEHEARSLLAGFETMSDTMKEQLNTTFGEMEQRTVEAIAAYLEETSAPPLAMHAARILLDRADQIRRGAWRKEKP